jgi:uncharacterized protein (TIRG00374 family)
MASFVHRWLYRFIGIIILISILITVDFTKLWVIVKESERLWLVSIALPLTFVIVFIRFYRWYRINKYEQIMFPFWEGLLIYIASFGLGIITPARVGEFIKINYLRNSGCSTVRAIFSVLVDRFSDVALMILVTLISSCVLFDVYEGKIIQITLASIVTLSILIFYICKRPRRPSGIKYALKTHSNIISLFLRELDRIPDHLGKIGWFGAGEIATLTTVSWLFFFIQNFLFSISFDFRLNFLQIAFITSAVGLVTLIPISISGLGTRDVTLIYFFSLFGLEKEQALIFSSCMFFTVIIYALISFFPWEMESIRRKLIPLKKDFK